MTTHMHLTHCTLTGVDEKTDVQDLIDLSVEHPIAEWGVPLLTKTARPTRALSIHRILEKDFH